MRLGKLITIAAALLLSAQAQAKELYGPDVGVVPFGMGRAYSAIADDALSLYYNPAGLALVKKVDFELFDLRVESNRDLIQSYSNVSGLTKSSQSNVSSALSKFAGKHVMGDASNNTQITVPHFAFGINYDVHSDVDLENLVYPQTEMRYTKDLSFVMGGAISFGKYQDLRVGTTLKWTHRTGGTQSILVSDIAGNTAGIAEKFSTSGSGVAGDLGMQYRLPVPGRTEFTSSFVWHDIGNTSFGTAQQQNAPTRIQQNMVAGLGVRFPIGGTKNRRLERRYGPTRSTSHLSFAFDYSYLNIPITQEDFGKHSHFGMNLDLPILSLQLGLNQTSLTAGTSIDVGIVRVALATYGEELGSYVGQKRDRRYLISVGSGFGFGGF